MPYIIKNISRTNKRFKEPVPITLEFKDDFGCMIKHVIQPDDSIILYFIPATAKIMHINNMISIDHISSNDVKLFSIKSENTITPDINEDIINNINEDIINNSIETNSDDITKINISDNNINEEEGIDIIIDDNGISESDVKTKRKKN
jgi:hypothetical protein